jgi:hypothetical protein
VWQIELRVKPGLVSENYVRPECHGVWLTFFFCLGDWEHVYFRGLWQFAKTILALKHWGGLDLIGLKNLWFLGNSLWLDLTQYLGVLWQTHLSLNYECYRTFAILTLHWLC